MDDHILTANDIAVIEEFTTHAIRDEEDLWQRLQDTGARLAETLFLAAHRAPQSAGLTETVEDALGEWEALQDDIENESTRMNQRLEDAVETVEIDRPNLADLVHALACAARHTVCTYEHSTKEELGDDVRWTVIELFREMKGEQLMPFEREFRHAYKNDPKFRAAIDQQRERELRGEPPF